MGKSISDYEFKQRSSLSQRVGFHIPEIQNLSGSDPEISDAIAVLTYIKEPNNFKKSTIDFTIGLLNVLRLSHFATSDRTDVITKMGFMLPAKESVFFDERHIKRSD